MTGLFWMIVVVVWPVVVASLSRTWREDVLDTCGYAKSWAIYKYYAWIDWLKSKTDEDESEIEPVTIDFAKVAALFQANKFDEARQYLLTKGYKLEDAGESLTNNEEEVEGEPMSILYFPNTDKNKSIMKMDKPLPVKRYASSDDGSASTFSLPVPVNEEE